MTILISGILLLRWMTSLGGYKAQDYGEDYDFVSDHIKSELPIAIQEEISSGQLNIWTLSSGEKIQPTYVEYAYCCYLNFHRTRLPRKLRFEFWSTSMFTGGRNEKELMENWSLGFTPLAYWNLNNGGKSESFFGVDSRENWIDRFEDDMYR